MDWIYFVILATFFWAIGNVMDKYLIDKKVKNPTILFIFFRVVFFIPLILLTFLLRTGIPSLYFFIMIFIGAAFTVVAILLYYKIVEMEEISISIPLFQFIPIFTIFIAFFALGERLAIMDYVGFLVLVLGGFVISLKKVEGFFATRKVFWFVLLDSLLFSLYYIILKFVLTYVAFWDVFIWVWIFQSILIVFFAFSGQIRKDFKYYWKKINWKDWTIISANMALATIAVASYNFAIKIGSISLIQASENVQMIFVFVLALLFTHFFPTVLKEKFDRRALLQKISGMILIIIGVLLTQWF
jgi:drug/metabolite transporter (DMT)-like permease